MRNFKWDRIDERNFYETCRNNIIKRENVHFHSLEQVQENVPNKNETEQVFSQDDMNCRDQDFHSQAEQSYQEQLISELLQPEDTVTEEQIEQLVKSTIENMNSQIQ